MDNVQLNLGFRSLEVLSMHESKLNGTRTWACPVLNVMRFRVWV